MHIFAVIEHKLHIFCNDIQLSYMLCSYFSAFRNQILSEYNNTESIHAEIFCHAIYRKIRQTHAIYLINNNKIVQYVYSKYSFIKQKY